MESLALPSRLRIVLYLLFQVRDDRYAIAAKNVAEVVPLVRFKLIPQTHQSVLGVFNYHGTLVPVIDLTHLMTGHRSRDWLSTRIILVRYTQFSDHLLGLVAESVLDTAKLLDEEFSDPGVASIDAPYLGRVANFAGKIVQRVDVQKILPAEIQSTLFTAAMESRP